MSTGSPTQPTRTTPPQGTSTTVQTVVGYLTPIVAIVGLFVLIAINKLDPNVGIPIIAGITGYHGGAAINGTNTTN